jgi:mannose-6-phosphate isomerase-like protein (cupin superfamily)
MTTTQGPITSAAAIFLGPGEGPAIHMGSLPLVFKTLSAWTNGAYEMHEQRLGPGVLVAPHTHVYQDQVNYVLTGTLGCLVGDQEFEAPAGSFIWRPRGVRHALWSSEIEEFFRRFGDLTDAGAATAEAIQALAEPYGISYDLDIIPSLESRHGVSAGGAWWAE